MSQITTFTSVIGERDILREDQNSEGSRLVAFVDRQWNSNIWAQHPAYDKFSSRRRNSRAPKILAHQFIDTEYSIWIDGKVALRAPAARLIDELLLGYDIAVFKHPKRTCCYAEGAECADRKLDNPTLITAQLNKYEKHQFPQNYGLAECCVILRRHSPKVESFNNYWWSEYCRFSVRDQISFMYAARATGVNMRIIPSNVHEHPFLDVIVKRRAEPETY